VGKGFDSSWVALSVRLVIERIIIIIVPLITSFLLKALLLLVLVIDPAMCISVTDDVAQVSIIQIMPLAMLLWLSESVS
jgi:hypothetical protein